MPDLAVVLSVNVSPNQLLAPQFLDTVEHALSRSGMDPAKLCLEVTEHTIVQDTEQTAKILSLLRDRGVKVAIDDFGTGFSSLINLKIFPVHVLKIDRAFVQNLESDEQDQAIVRAVVSLAKSFDLKVVAEGVESSAASEALVSMGPSKENHRGKFGVASNGTSPERSTRFWSTRNPSKGPTTFGRSATEPGCPCSPAPTTSRSLSPRSRARNERSNRTTTSPRATATG
jgi:predicted signal transduction protein with EAL and GGDEF domain